MLETYALILLLSLTDEEQLLAKDFETLDPVDYITETELSKTYEVQDQVFFEDYQDQEG